jgi:arylsulfatase A-like enzyme
MNGIPLSASIPTVPGALSAAGYRTHSCGKIHLSCSRRGSDAETVEDRSGYPDLHALYKKGRLKEMPLPYFGFDGVDLCEGHATTSWGHYNEWLKREHPEEARLFFEEVPLEEPGPAFRVFNRKSFKWALPAALHPMTWIADRTMDFLTDAATRPGEPFFLVCSIQEPHSPFAPPREYAHRFDPAEVPGAIGREGELDELPPHFRAMREEKITTSGNPAEPMNLTDPYRDECAAHYFSLIEMLDDQVGRVLRKLEESGLRENTVVIFLADHGEALGDHGLWGKGPYHFDSVIRVPFLVSWPGQFPEGVVHDGLANLLDVGPTVLDLAGVAIPEGPSCDPPEAPSAPPPWPGRSLVPVLRGKDKTGAERTLVEMDEDYLGFKMRTLVTRRYRITQYSGQPYGELFDLENDPQELHNLWNDPAHRELRDGLRLELLDEVLRTDSSLPRQINRS